MNDELGIQTVKALHECFSRTPTFLVIRKALLLSTRLHWGDDTAHGDEAEMLLGLVYTGDSVNDPTVRTLKVDIEDTLRAEDRYTHPAIFLGFGEGVGFSKKTINNLAALDFTDGSKAYTMAGEGACTFAHIHSSADTALAMAEDTLLYMYAIRDSMMCNLYLTAFDIVRVSSPTLVKEAKELCFRVDITVKFSFNPSVTVTRGSLRLKKWTAAIENQ